METRKLSPRDAYKVDGIYEFRVRKQFPTYCEVVDESTDITTYLRGTANLKLFKGQSVKCRILSIKEKHPRIELVDISEFEQNKVNLTEEKLTDLLSKRELTWNTKDFIRLLLTDENEKSFESQCHKWIQNLINKKIDLMTVRMDCSDILELSELLDLCSDAERDYYQERLTTLIEQLGYYIKAAKLIGNQDDKNSTETPDHFINSLFNKLRISGFVYHPIKNFNILASLFLSRPELMNNSLYSFFERNGMPNNKTKDNIELIKNNMQALALQLLLHHNTNDNTIADYRLNTARLCIISSYLYPLHPDWLVDMAYFYLFHSNAHLMNYTMDNIGLIPHYIASLYPGGKIDTVNSFTQNRIKLMVSADGIQLFSSGADSTLKPVFPKDLGLWQGLQVFLDGKTNTNLNNAKPNDITPYQKIWEEIENELFNVASAVTAPIVKTKKQHHVNEIVRISFIRQDVSNRNKYWCKIEDEIGGDGYIMVGDIVPYTITTSLRHFLAPDGSRYIFEARIIDDEDGSFHFSMLKEMKEAALDYYTYDEDIICSLGGASIQGGLAPAVSKEGISVSIKNAGEFEGVGKNTIVKCRLLGRGTGTFHIQCEMTDVTSYDFDMTSAFRILMEDYSVGKISENISSQEEEDILESDRVLDESYVREIIFLIDRMAIIDKDYVKSYNYLAFARTLCLLIGWEAQAAYYKGRMDIITMLHYFARNSKVDEQRLEQLENVNAELFSNNIILRERFLQLQAVSFLDKPEHNDDLYEVAKNNPNLHELASLVLAYNITKTSKMESTATDIHNRIKQQLNLKGFETGLKLYGTGEETIDTEYKTSIVFPAGNSHSANPDKQMEEIMKVINSFLNTVGGTLYVGVNDYGLGTGVEEDLNYTLYYGDKDKYLRAIPDAMSIKWGNSLATTYIEDIYFDSSNHDKDILVVKIKPHQMGVPFDGHYYVRVGSTKRKLTKEEFAEYQKLNRKLPEQVETTTKDAAEQSQEQDKQIVTVPLITSKEDEVHTSRIRKNVLAEYLDPDNYVEPVAFFKFLGNGKFRKLDQYDYDDQSLLTLTVLENEIKSWLILGYDNGHIAKVSVEELMEYQERDYSRFADAKLIFASFANDDDAVLTISRENKTRPKVVMRMDTVTNFEEGKLMDNGEMPFNEKLASEFLAYDIIPSKYKHQFDGILDKIKSFVGYPLNQVTKPMVNTLHLWGINEI